MHGDTAVLEIRGLVKQFGDVVANGGIDLTVQPGMVVGLLGHNGAGKTTLVSQVVGLLRPDEGRIEVAGVDAAVRPAAARERVALQAQAQAPLDGLTPRTAIEIAARLRGLGAGEARAAAVRLADELDIGPWLDRRALPDGGGISGGVRRLAGFAMAAVAPTPLVILDEPSNDIDPARRQLLWQAVRRLADAGAGVLLVTHNVVEAERVVDRLVILDHGRVVADGTPSELHQTRDQLRLELTLHPGSVDAWAPDALPFTVTRRARSGRRLLLAVPPDHAAAAVSWAREVRERDAIDGFALVPATLEDAYLALTTAQSEPMEELSHV